MHKNNDDSIHQQYNANKIDDSKNNNVEVEFFEIFEEEQSNELGPSVNENTIDKDIFYYRR